MKAILWCPSPSKEIPSFGSKDGSKLPWVFPVGVNLVAIYDAAFGWGKPAWV